MLFCFLVVKVRVQVKGMLPSVLYKLYLSQNFLLQFTFISLYFVKVFPCIEVFLLKDDLMVFVTEFFLKVIREHRQQKMDKIRKYSFS